ncbi:MAG: MBOAT family protein [Bacteroidales bacterium]|nr:MBOAT family protein [Bacteroidales bacterium]
MPFNSLNFWFVFPLVFALYWVIPVRYNQWRKVFLILASYLLYMNWKPAFAIVLMGVTLITFFGSLLIEGKQPHKKKRLAWLFAFLALLPLLVFKYYNFLNDSVSHGLAAIGLKFSMPGLNWAIPVGISFFTFQAVGYMLDVYHGKVNAERDILDYVLFVSFFPQVASGPISAANELLPQIKEVHHFDYDQGRQGLKFLLWGMFIKLVIADRLGLFVDTVYANYIHYNGTTCFVASVFYSIQIYCDFAGYSLMAIGIARTLGFNLPDNFRRPYFAISITDFWRRWHITLTRWLTQHIYIPMGGNRCGKIKNYWNIFVTFLVSGIWHGANWTFVIWGCMHGFFQIIEKAVGLQKYEGKSKTIRTLRIFVTFLLVNFAWIFFRMPDISSAGIVVGKIFSDFGVPELSGLDVFSQIILFLGIAILIVKDFRVEFLPDRFAFLQKSFFRWSVYVVLFVMILTLGVLDSGQFIYVNF